MSEPLIKEQASDGEAAAMTKAAATAAALKNLKTAGTNGADTLSFQPEISSSSSSSEDEEDDDEVNGDDSGDFPTFDEMKDSDELNEANGFGDFPGGGNDGDDNDIRFGSAGFGDDGGYDDHFGDPDGGVDDDFGDPDEGEGFGDFPDF